MTPDQPMTPEAIGLCLCLLCVVVCAIALCFAPSDRPKRNRRHSLPAPRPDERNSITQFKRIHSK